MRAYEIKRGHWKNIEGEALPALVQELFGPVTKHADGTLEASYKALTKLTVRYVSKTQLDVDTVMDTKASTPDAQATIRAYSTFLERATGLTAKERTKRAKKDVEKDAPE